MRIHRSEFDKKRGRFEVPEFSIMLFAAFGDGSDFRYALFACFFPLGGDVKASLMPWLGERAFRLSSLVAEDGGSFAFGGTHAGCGENLRSESWHLKEETRVVGV
jgi:hypothetical protein